MHEKIAKLMVVATRDYVIPALHDVLDIPYSNINVSVRVGSGAKTYHKKKSVGNHIIVFGKKMVQSKMFSYANAERWLTGREIVEKGYAGGKLTLQSVFIHTIMHEVAHFVQVLEGGRVKNSVHNSDFYDALDRMYRSRAYKMVKEFLMSFDDFANLEFQNDQSEKVLPEYGPADVRVGDKITFVVRGGGTLTMPAKRVNRKTVTVKYTRSDVYVPYFFIRGVIRNEL